MDVFLVFGIYIIRQAFVGCMPCDGSVSVCVGEDAQRLPTTIIEDIGAERLGSAETVGSVGGLSADITVERLDGACIVAHQQLTEMGGCCPGERAE